MASSIHASGTIRSEAANVSETVAALEAPEDAERKHRSLWGDVWIQYRKHRLAMVGTAILAFVILFVLVGPVIYGVDPQFIDFTNAHAKPSLEHPFGTDELGRDTLARVMSGGRISLAVGVSAMLVAIFLGAAIGGLAGYYRSLDSPLMRFTDMFLALPLLPLLLVIQLLFRDPLRTAFGIEVGTFILIVTVIGVLAWMPTARVVRGDVLSIKENEFVTAATSIGTRQRRILSRHIFPNVLSPIMVAATLGIAAAIITESALSFLGFGFPSDFPTWGRLLFDGKDFLTVNFWLVFWPGLFISLTVLSVNFIGDGLRDALDPRQRGR
ncbi:MAG: ABC transporter permease [Chloroflexota bacterium]|nr:MAG: ABC transporter permease [Chloroflexota bacterium]